MAFKLGLFVCLLPVLANMATAEQDPAALSAAVKGINDFAVEFYLATAGHDEKKGNLLVSPLSASLATAMVNEGAVGETSNQIVKALHLPADKATRDSGFSALHDRLKNTKNVTLDVANKIFIEQSFKLKDDYLNTVRRVHQSEVEKSDFMKQPEQERVKINDWVAKSTNNKIKDLLQPNTITPLSRLVLINAVYFYGKWQNKFESYRTRPEDFFVTKDNPIKVDMMHMTETIGYAEIPELNAKAVELLYQGGDVAMQIILPNEKDGLAEMEQKLRTFDLSTIQFTKTKVALSLPKFKLETTIDLKKIYMKMGMTKMFSGADFSLMSDEPLEVSDAVQKTFMDVNEEGTEAAAATVIGIQLTSEMIYLGPITEMSVDRPFLLRLVKQDTPVFLGAVTRPPLSA